MTPQENARKNFDRYNKLKRTCEALQKLTVETKEAIEHLESIRTALDIALSEEDLVQIKEELTQYGYIRRKHAGKKVKITSRPLHFLSGDGYHIYTIPGAEATTKWRLTISRKSMSRKSMENFRAS